MTLKGLMGAIHSFTSECMRYDYTCRSESAAASSFCEGIFMLISSKGVGIQALDAALLRWFKCMQTQ